jgi:glycerol-3-phosphate dehydrogenase (NAD(P)+)
MKITVTGDGGWGTTLALLLCRKGHDVTLWGVFRDHIEDMQRTRLNSKFLAGVRLDDELNLEWDLEKALSGSEMVLLASPSEYMRETCAKVQKYLTGSQIIVSVSKGIETSTLKRMSEVIREILGGDTPLVVLSGPSLAMEVARGIPTMVTVSSNDLELAKKVQQVFITEKFRVYTSDDMLGVELGGSLKNVIAIAAGIIDGMQLGANTKSGLVTRGLAEITRLGTAMGADPKTFAGLSGLGDLITTCVSDLSRNHWFGMELGKGVAAEKALSSTEMVVEGVRTAEAAHKLAQKYSVEMPITEKIYSVIYKGEDPVAAIRELMTRKPKAETGTTA